MLNSAITIAFAQEHQQGDGVDVQRIQRRMRSGALGPRSKRQKFSATAAETRAKAIVRALFNMLRIPPLKAARSAV